MEIIEATPEAIAELKHAFGSSPVLSVYLPYRPGINAPQGYKAEMLNVLRTVREQTEASQQERYDEFAARLLTFVREEYQPSSQALALFASGGEKSSALAIELPLPGLARFQDGPFLAPLVAAVEDNPTVAIVCVGEREDRVIVACLGTLQSSTHDESDVLGRQRQGGWAAARFEAERAADVREHMRDVAQRIEKLTQEQPFKWLVLGGVKELTNVVTEELPAHLQSLVAGSFAFEMFATDSELMKAGLAVADEAERRQEVSLATSIKDKALARGAASLGWDETLARLDEGRVHLLAMPRSKLGNAEADLALQRAWAGGAEIEFISGEAEQVLQAYGGIGALLRF